MIEGKRVLVTGGTGTLGKALLRRLLSGELGAPSSILVLSRGEELQLTARQMFRDDRLRFRIGDVRDYHTVAAVLREADVVFHAAALKQVPACEYFTREAIETNVNGSANLIRAICDFGLPVEAVVGISTDKACRPVNVYGMTKAVQERMFIEANLAAPTRFLNVRYGNVLASRGSVIPIFREQIRKGQPITVTTPEMTRFWMSVDSAVDAVFATLLHAKPGEVWVPQCKSARLVDLARAMIADAEVEVVFTGMRPGEKVHEILISPEEQPRTVIGEHGYFAIRPMLEDFPDDRRPVATGYGTEYSSATNLMSAETLLGYIDEPHTDLVNAGGGR